MISRWLTSIKRGGKFLFKMVRILYDFETLMVKKGVKRRYTIPIEIAMFAMGSCNYYSSKISVSMGWEMNHDVSKSLRCIAKLGGLGGSRSISLVERELMRFVELGEPVTLIAHNGKAFDDHIFRECFPLFCESVNPKFVDSLHLLRRLTSCELSTYSLPILSRAHRSAIKGYMASTGMPQLHQHRALYDVVALYHVLSKVESDAYESTLAACGSLCISDRSSRSSRSSRGLKNEWLDIKGVGVKTGGIMVKHWESVSDFREEMSNMNATLVKKKLREIGVRRYDGILSTICSDVNSEKHSSG